MAYVLSGFGTSAVNGTYEDNATTKNSARVYKKTGASYYIYRGAAVWCIGTDTSDTNPTILYTNSASAVLSPPLTGWVSNAGGSPPGDSPIGTVTPQLTERYVTSSAGGSGDGTSGNPWTLTQALANATPGDRVNIKTGTYTVTTSVTLTNSGTGQAIIFRGYDTTITDGYQGRTNGNGALVTTKMPNISFTGSGRLSVATNVILESINFTRTSSTSTSSMITVSGSRVSLIRCVAADSSTGASVNTLNGVLNVIDCDVSTNNSSGGACILPVTGANIIGCRLQATSGSGVLINAALVGVTASRCTFFSMTTGIKVTSTSGSGAIPLAQNCTAYGLTGAFIELPNNATSAPVTFPVLVDCHVTDCAYVAYSQYTTLPVPTIEVNLRTRDNTNADTGFGDWPAYGAVTTDGGGASTDYADAAGGDFRLVSSAPGKAAGVTAYGSIGALEPVATGGAPGFSSPLIRAA